MSTEPEELRRRLQALVGHDISVDGGEILIHAGAPVTVRSSGVCGPGNPVSVTLEAVTHATDELATVPADASGSFVITVNVPNLGAPANLSASCVGDTSGEMVSTRRHDRLPKDEALIA